MPEISQKTKELVQAYQGWFSSLQAKEKKSTISVDEVALKVAVFYEKIREIVDWREEHLIKKSAIERVLKRRLFLLNDKENIAEPLILELIRGGHFPNGKIDDSKIKEVNKIINKYVYILEKVPQGTDKQKNRFNSWLLEIAACEIEETLSPPIREKALIKYMTELMMEKIELKEGILVINGISKEEKNIQIYIATQRALFKLDSPIITYNLLKRKFPEWHNLIKESPELTEITKNIYQIRENIEKNLKHSLSYKFYKICEKYDSLYLILGDVLSEDPMAANEIMKNPEKLEQKINKAYSKRLKNLNLKIKRAAVYATLSIFLTKILLALAIEMPLDKYITEEFNYFALGINIITPPLLMFLLILTINPPAKENLYQVIMGITKIIYKNEKQDTYILETPKKRGIITNFLVTLFYLFTFLIAFGFITWILLELNFSIFSILIFLLFISLISFAGVKLRERSKELDILEKKDSFLVFFFDIFSMPIIQVGKWLSGQWAKYNIIIVLINLLIELPFQTFVEFLEQWRYFLKEKKEKIH
jgi:hypothetical protein